MEEQNNQNIDTNIPPNTFQQPINAGNENKPNKKLYLFFALIALVIIISGIGLALYQKNQNTQALKKKLNIPQKSIDTNNITVDEGNNIEENVTPENTNIAIDDVFDNTFLITDGNTIYETDLNRDKTKIVDLPYPQPIEVLETFISKDKNTFLWTHTKNSENDMSPEPRDIISYIYRRNTDSLKKFSLLETKTNEQKIFPIQLSPNGKYLMAKKIDNGKTQLVAIETETETKTIIFDNYDRRWDQLDGYDEIEDTEFWKWNDDSQSFYYTNSLSTSDAGSKLWKKKYIRLLKYNLTSKKSNITLEGKEVCNDFVGLIPSKYNENVAIVSCGSTEYNEKVKVYIVGITTKKSELVFEGYNRDIDGIHIKTVTPDGNKFIYYLLPQQSLFVYDTTKKERKRIDLKQKLNGTYYFSNDGSKLLYKNQHLPVITEGIFSYDFETEEITHIFKDAKLDILDL